jgi:AbiA family abortive infection protein
MMADDTSTIGHFLSVSLWREALKLLDFQIDCQSTNRHFKTLSMIYYQKLGDEINELESEDYFKQRVANNLFYGLEEEFSIHPYVVPKPGLGLRRYGFFTYPMRVLYYAVGLYLLRVSEEFINNFYNTRKQLKSYYGGRLYFQGDELQLTKSNIYFKNYYTRFRNQVRRETTGDVSNKIVIRLDIQNYYEVISIPLLMGLLDKNIKSSQKATWQFDTNTQEQIMFFFRFLANDGEGIPQSDNSIVSSFIGHLYLVFGDLLIEEEIYKDQEVVEDYSLIRYVDDTFISITFREDLTDGAQKEYAESLGARVSDRLYYELGLRFNPKTRFFCLSDEDQLENLLSSLKKVSPQYHLSDERDEESPVNKIDNIFDELEKLKGASVRPETFELELQDEILKEVLDKRVNQMLSMEGNKKRIRRIFSGFDFNRVKEYPLTIMIILLKEDSTARRFRKFLLQKQNLTTRDVDLMLTYLCQVDFQDPQLLGKLEKYTPMSRIMRVVQKASLSSDKPGYYDLPESKVLKLARMPYVIEQVRHRVFHERTRSYSVALNHLLNEIHAICYQLDGATNHREYKAHEVERFLRSQMVPPDVCIGIRNPFDRRNTNQVSHPGCEESVAWSVASEEYVRYRLQVGKCLGSLLK